jgi:DNA polymerase
MTRQSTRAEFDRLRLEAAACRRCDLYEHATQTVFGDGNIDAPLMLVGEAPGDHEDRAGHPFVGPAGHLLFRALDDADIERDDVYVTNAVKHFKWRPQGKVRVHQKPTAREIEACRPWWRAEIDLLQPRLVCCLGATAAQSLLGKNFRVTKQRAEFFPLGTGTEAVATVHPASVLRSRDRDRAYAGLVADLRIVAERLQG